MIRSSIILLFIISFLTINVYAQTQTDSNAIKNTALDYIEGWYERDAQRMESALHPKLVKRLMRKTPDGKYLIGEHDASILIKNTGKGEGYRVPPAEQQKDITILDQFGDAAVVKVTANRWVDYLQMVKWKGDWKILNVLWELK